MFLEIVLGAIVLYLLCGLLFTIPFLVKGLPAIDEGARGSTVGFRIIITPGIIVFWPFLLKKWIKAKPTARDKIA